MPRRNSLLWVYLLQVRKSGLSVKKKVEVFQFATGEIPLGVLYRKKGLCQGWLCRETDFFSDQWIFGVY